MTIKEMAKKVAGIKKKEIGLNIFYAIGMANQEIKHSHFLAWLFDPSETHGMKDTFLEKFCKELVNYEKYYSTNKIINRNIISKATAITNSDGLYKKCGVCVTKEKYQPDDGRRRDVFIVFDNAQITITIENKTFSGTHDDQLQSYEQDVANNYNTHANIFVYLSPKGDMPLNKNKTIATNWCVIDYSIIIKIIEEILYEKKGINRKLKSILEDYIKMAKTVIVKNVDMFDECRKLYLKNKNAFDIFIENINKANKVVEYCHSELERMAKQKGYDVTMNTNGSIEGMSFTIPKIQKYLSYQLPDCKAYFNHDNSTYGCYVAMEGKPGSWSSEHIQLANIAGKCNPNKHTKVVTRHVLISDNDIAQEININNLKTKIDNNIDMFFKAIEDLESKL